MFLVVAISSFLHFGSLFSFWAPACISTLICSALPHPQCVIYTHSVNWVLFSCSDIIPSLTKRRKRTDRRIESIMYQRFL